MSAAALAAAELVEDDPLDEKAALVEARKQARLAKITQEIDLNPKKKAAYCKFLRITRLQVIAHSVRAEKSPGELSYCGPYVAELGERIAQLERQLADALERNLAKDVAARFR